MSRALVVGCGYVGRALAAQLLADGVEVWGLRRRPPEGDDGIRWLVGDVSVQDGLAAALEPLAARRDPVDLFYLVSADGFDDEAYRRAYVVGIDNLLAAFAGGGIRRLIHASSTGVYAQTDGEWVDEDSPTEPSGFSGKRLLEGEAVARRCEAPAVVLRFGGIYGPGRTRLIDRLVAGEALADLERAQFRSRMHRDDCAAAMRHCARLDEPKSCYVAVDDEPSDQRDVQAWLCDELGVDAATLSPVRSRRRGTNKRCRNQRLRDSGLRLSYPTFREGYGALLDELGLR